jgi:hypothetical protein
MAYGGDLWAGKARAQKWRETHPVEADEIRREGKRREKMLAQENMTHLRGRDKWGRRGVREVK